MAQARAELGAAAGSGSAGVAPRYAQIGATQPLSGIKIRAAAVALRGRRPPPWLLPVSSCRVRRLLPPP